MTLRTPRDTPYPFKHRSGVGASNSFDTTYPKGGPLNPRAHVGNHVTLKFDLDVPIIGAASDADFSLIPEYASYAFTADTYPWLKLTDGMAMDPTLFGVDTGPNNHNLILTSATVAVGLYVDTETSANPAWEEVSLEVRAYNSGMTQRQNASFFTATGNDRIVYTVFDKVDYMAELSPFRRLCINPDYPVLAVRVRNLDAAPTLAGRFTLYFEGFEG